MYDFLHPHWTAFFRQLFPPAQGGYFIACFVPAQDIAFTGQLVVGLFYGHLADAGSLSQFTHRIETHTGYHAARFYFLAIIFVNLYIKWFADRFVELQHCIRPKAPSPLCGVAMSMVVSVILYCTEKCAA